VGEQYNWDVRYAPLSEINEELRTTPCRDGLYATAQLVEGESLQPIRVSLTANDSTSNRTFLPMCAGSRIHSDVGERRLYGTGNEVQADGGPPILGSPQRSVRPTRFEDDVPKLKAKLLAKGADKQIMELCDQVFKNGVTIEVLEKRTTGEECGRLGAPDGKQFRQFLEVFWRANGQMESHRCRLCPLSKIYKKHRDALRHLLKDHFGLSF
jgi:hypothetical protein